MSAVTDIEKDITQAKLEKSIAESLTRLVSNKDYIAVIGSGYLEKYALGLIDSMCEAKSAEYLTLVTRRLDAVSQLKGYLSDVISKGDTADHRMLQSELELDSLRAEEMQ